MDAPDHRVDRERRDRPTDEPTTGPSTERQHRARDHGDDAAHQGGLDRDDKPRDQQRAPEDLGTARPVGLDASHLRFRHDVAQPDRRHQRGGLEALGTGTQRKRDRVGGDVEQDQRGDVAERFHMHRGDPPHPPSSGRERRRAWSCRPAGGPASTRCLGSTDTSARTSWTSGARATRSPGRCSTDLSAEQAVPSSALAGSPRARVQHAPRRTHDDHARIQVGFEPDTARVRCHRTTMQRLERPDRAGTRWRWPRTTTGVRRSSKA